MAVALGWIVAVHFRGSKPAPQTDFCSALGIIFQTFIVCVCVHAIMPMWMLEKSVLSFLYICAPVCSGEQTQYVRLDNSILADGTGCISQPSDFPDISPLYFTQNYIIH